MYGKVLRVEVVNVCDKNSVRDGGERGTHRTARHLKKGLGYQRTVPPWPLGDPPPPEEGLLELLALELADRMEEEGLLQVEADADVEEATEGAGEKETGGKDRNAAAEARGGESGEGVGENASETGEEGDGVDDYDDFGEPDVMCRTLFQEAAPRSNPGAKVLRRAT